MSCTIYDFSLNTKSSLTVLHPQCIKKKTFAKFVCNYKVEKNTKLERF